MQKITPARRKAVSTMIAAAVIIVIIVAVAAGVLIFSQRGSTSTETSSSTASSSSNSSSSSSSSTTSASSSVTSSSSNSNSSTSVTQTSVSQSSTVSYSGRLLVSFVGSGNLIGGPDVSISYPLSVNGLGNLPASVSFQPVTSQGVSLSFTPGTISLSQQATVMALVSVKNGTKSGNYNVQTVATGGGGSFNVTVTIQVVQYLVAFEPQITPGNLTVPVGSTVTWVRTNGLLGEHGANGSQNIVFNNHMTSSPQLLQWQSYSYTFSQVGSFPYQSTYQGENGEVVVTSG
jgi:plastocyanin